MTQADSIQKQIILTMAAMRNAEDRESRGVLPTGDLKILQDQRAHLRRLEATLRDSWTTPKVLATNLVEEFGLLVDAASSDQNQVCPWRLGDGLGGLWKEPTWCNPPYSNILPWATNALSSDVLSVLLLPARTASPWFRLLVCNPRVSWWTFKGRVRFDPPEGIQASSPRHDTLLFAVHRHRGTGYQGIRDPKTGEILQKANQP